ncbi:MAG TPA: nodulation protein NfeD [Candidatus Limnocylindria bacterium]|nr:nodulation protein NfeD [Candidatus Limnocylindria bacterium]
MSRGARPDVPRRRISRLPFALMAMGWLLLAGSTRAAGPEVMVLPTTGIVDGSMAKYLEDSITLAEGRNVAAVVIKLNTPGGRLDSTNDIVGSILEAQVPVIVWVAPAGGFAASAGTFITLSGNLALMAPGTSIGAASPISGDGEDIDGTLGQKVLNDAIAKITSIANARDRNVEWAVGTVRDAKSSPAEEAVAVGAVDGIAATIEEVLAFADGKTVEVGGQPVTLELTGATTSEQAMNPFLAIIRLLSDPTIALLLFSTGSAGLLAELYSPNFVTGILGALMVLLALIGLGTLPLNVGGLLLIIFGMVLFGLELTVTSHGLLGVGGLVCFALGASALFSGPVDPFEPLVRVAPPVIMVVTATLGVIMVLIVVGAVRSRRIGLAAALGGQGIIGSTGEVRSPLSPIGSVVAGGEEWSARTADGRTLERGTPVRIVKVEGLTLTVEPDASSSVGT